MDTTGRAPAGRWIAIAEVVSGLLAGLGAAAYGFHQHAQSGHLWTNLGAAWIGYSLLVGIAVVASASLSASQWRATRWAAHVAVLLAALGVLWISLEGGDLFWGWRGTSKTSPRTRRWVARGVAAAWAAMAFLVVGVPSNSSLAGLAAAASVGVAMYWFTRLLYGKRWNEKPPPLVPTSLAPLPNAPHNVANQPVALALRGLRRSNATGTLTARHGETSIEIHLLLGTVVHAHSPSGDGDEAVIAAVSWVADEVASSYLPAESLTLARTVDRPLDDLIAEGLRRRAHGGAHS